jgi:two-component system, sensor histidine kinase
MNKYGFLSIGSEDIRDKEAANRIYITNMLSLIFGLTLLLMSPVMFLLFGMKTNILIPLCIEFLLNALVPVLNWRRKHNLASSVLYYVQCVAIAYFGLQFGQLLQLQFTVVFLVYINYLVFRDALRRKIGLFAALADLLLLEVSYYLDNGRSLAAVSHGNAYVVHLLVMAAVIIICYQLSRPYVKSNDLRYSLEKANALIRIFAAQVAHELRTPLNSILHATELLRKEVQRDESLRKIQQLVNSTYIASATARDIVENVLGLSEIEAGQQPAPVARPLSIRDFLMKMIEVHRIIAAENEMRLQLSIEMPEVIIADPLMISQILNNLVNNAIKYGARGSTIVIDAACGVGTWELKVTNAGQGIPADKIPFIFDPFVTWRNGGNQGTGLGLYIVRSKAEAMRGRVGVESVSGGLTTFTVTLPLTVGETGQIEVSRRTQDEQTINMDDIHILMAEDQRVMAFILGKSLEQLGCQVTAVSNGKELLEAAQKWHAAKHPFDLIILDSQMPEMGGEETIGHLKSIPTLRDIPIIVTTGDIFSGTINKLMSVGADAYLKKPFDQRALKETISRQLMKKR